MNQEARDKVLRFLQQVTPTDIDSYSIVMPGVIVVCTTVAAVKHLDMQLTDRAEPDSLHIYLMLKLHEQALCFDHGFLPA